MISIVCPVHNKLNYTKKCIESLLTAIDKCIYGCEIEIIIVDDGSTDGTSEYINKNYSKIKVIKGDGNLWWSGAMNLGTTDAISRGTEYVLLINNDNIFKDDYLDTLIRFTKSHGFKIVGSKILDLHTNEICSCGGHFNVETGWLDLYYSPKTKDVDFYDVDWLGGMGTLIHHSVFKEIGFWDEKNFPQYFGDSDFTLRAKENGIVPFIYLKSVLWNDTLNTGQILHGGKFIRMLNSLFSIRSHYHIVTSFKFLRKHHVSWKGIFQHFISKHGKFVGGFFKHKLLGTKYNQI